MTSLKFVFLLLLNVQFSLLMVTTTTTDKIYKYLRSNGLTHNGACGMLGNLYAESACQPETVEGLLIQRYDEDYKGSYSSSSRINGGYRRPVNTAENREYNNQVYTSRVMDGTITESEFLSPRGYTGVKHQYGYGLVQWTTRGRKQGLWDRTMKVGKPIYDLQIQVDYLVYELKNSFSTVYSYLTSSSRSLKECSDIVLTKFEAPADADSMKDTRYKYSSFYSSAYAS